MKNMHIGVRDNLKVDNCGQNAILCGSLLFKESIKKC